MKRSLKNVNIIVCNSDGAIHHKTIKNLNFSAEKGEKVDIKQLVNAAINHMKEEIDIYSNEYMISYFSQMYDTFVFCGVYPSLNCKYHLKNPVFRYHFDKMLINCCKRRTII